MSDAALYVLAALGIAFLAVGLVLACVLVARAAYRRGETLSHAELIRWLERHSEDRRHG